MKREVFDFGTFMVWSFKDRRGQIRWAFCLRSADGRAWEIHKAVGGLLSKTAAQDAGEYAAAERNRLQGLVS